MSKRERPSYIRDRAETDAQCVTCGWPILKGESCLWVDPDGWCNPCCCRKCAEAESHALAEVNRGNEVCWS